MSTAPRRLGKYELQQQVGRGNVGEVWLARDVSSHRDVAIKIIHSDLQSDPHFLARFTSQGPAIASLRQANIVQVHETNVSRNAQSGNATAYVAMDYIHGQTLAHFIHATSHRGHIPSVADILYLFTKLGPAIDYAHQHGLFHGDIKPGNILLNKQQTTKFAAGEPMLTDIGTVQIFGTINNIGLPFYISPEQAAGYPINDRSDIYALGVILYEICTGVTPFRSESSTALMLQHINTLPTPPILINPNIPPALSEVILRAMAKNPGTRFPHASHIATAIAEACSMESSLHVVREVLADDSKQSMAPPILGVSQPLPAVRLKSLSLPGLKSLPSSNPLSPPAASVEPKTETGKLAEQTYVQETKQDQQATMPTIPSTPVAVTGLNRQSPPASTAWPMSSNPYPPTIVPPPQPSIIQYPGSGPSGSPGTGVPQPPLHQTPPVSQPPFSVRSSKSWWNFNNKPVYLVAGILLLLLIIVGSTITAAFLLNKQQVANNNVPGRVFFQDDALGHNDQLHVEMQNIANPANGQNYVLWLQDSQHKDHPLGVLPVKDRSISFVYQGDNGHTNLLSATEGFIITSENTASMPTSPTGSPIYRAMFSAAALPYLKNILYSTPGLPGNQAVASGIFETIKSMNDKATSIVDSLQGDAGLARRQATRVVEMIDGSSYASSSGDRPANLPSQLSAPIGLLSSPNQQGYIDILDKQLDNLKASATANAGMLQHIQNVKTALADLRIWLKTALNDNVKILKANNLKDPAIQSIALEQKQAAADAYTGHIVPPNPAPALVAGSAGALQAYSESQYLATLDLQIP